MKVYFTITLLLFLYIRVLASNSQSDLGEIRGRITYDKKPLKGCMVRIYTNGCCIRDNIKTDIFGMYYCKALHPGAYTVNVSHLNCLVSSGVLVVTSEISSADINLPVCN